MIINRRPLGSTGLQVSELGFGALEIGRDWAPDVNSDPSHPDEMEATRVLNGLLDLGVNFIDTAPAYWSSEEFIGRAISHRRSEFILATKVGEHCDRNGSFYDYSAEATTRFVDQSLARLKTDVIDLLQIHSASMEVLERGETLSAMQAAQRAGKVRHLGMTGGVAECVRALELGGYETVQFPYNLLNLAAEDRLLALAREKNAGVIIMRGIAGGKLSAKFENLKDEKLKDAIRGFLKYVGPEPGKARDLVHLSLGYLLSRPEVSSVIIGTRRLDTVAANAEAAAQALSPSLLAEARDYALSLRGSIW
ncbi:MAG: aldo/keto reductase [Candidatus Sumerlaeaceae bacterium]|nr:aldo/keto reductase [Candidatus Sumerlaeaceae bacterium]